MMAQEDEEQAEMERFAHTQGSSWPKCPLSCGLFWGGEAFSLHQCKLTRGKSVVTHTYSKMLDDHDNNIIDMCSIQIVSPVFCDPYELSYNNAVGDEENCSPSFRSPSICDPGTVFLSCLPTSGEAPPSRFTL